MVNYAGFWKRFLANIIDGFILFIPSLFFSFFASRDLFFGVGLGFVMGFLYYPFFESSLLQATPGKALLDLAIVTETTHERISFKAAVIRFLGRYVSMLTLYIGYLMQPFTDRRQTLHDMISEVVVIKRTTTEDINYFVVWKNQLKEVINKL